MLRQGTDPQAHTGGSRSNDSLLYRTDAYPRHHVECDHGPRNSSSRAAKPDVPPRWRSGARYVRSEPRGNGRNARSTGVLEGRPVAQLPRLAPMGGNHNDDGPRTVGVVACNAQDLLQRDVRHERRVTPVMDQPVWRIDVPSPLPGWSENIRSDEAGPALAATPVPGSRRCQPALRTPARASREITIVGVCRGALEVSRGGRWRGAMAIAATQTTDHQIAAGSTWHEVHVVVDSRGIPAGPFDARVHRVTSPQQSAINFRS